MTTQESIEVSGTAVEIVGAPPALINTEDDTWGDVDDGDLSPSDLTRIPLLSLNRKIDGGFTIEDTGEITQTIDFVWLAKGKSRAWWPDPFGKGNTAPDCRSADGIKPEPSSPALQSETCAACPHSRWVGDDPPACHDAIDAMIFLPDPLSFGRLARLRFGGLAIAPARSYWDSFSVRLPRRPPIAYVSRITLEPVDTDNGKFLSPRFGRVRELSREEAQPLIDERNRRLEEWRRQVAEDVATAAPAAEEDGTAGSAPGSVPVENGEPF